MLLRGLSIGGVEIDLARNLIWPGFEPTTLRAHPLRWFWLDRRNLEVSCLILDYLCVTHNTKYSSAKLETGGPLALVCQGETTPEVRKEAPRAVNSVTVG